MVKIKDVAELSGVSVATVSRVLNNRGYISKETYEKVYDAIKQLDYVPNQFARSLYRQHSFYISLIVPDSSNPFWAEISHYIELKLYDHGYKLFLCNTDGNAKREREQLKMMRQNMVDGIILGTHMLHPDEYASISLPIVALDLTLSENIPTVCSDHQKGGELAAQELIRNRCRCVLNVQATTTAYSPSILRHQIVKRRLEEAGIKCITHIWDTNEPLSNYNAQVRSFFDIYPEIDAIFSEDYIVLNAINCARERGYRIPEDFKAVGYDGISICSLSFPSMTYVKQPIPQLADKLVEILLRKISGEDVRGTIILPEVSLVKGNSTLPF